ncbi:MAG: hypothetical protein HYY18_17495 [Planctomycetes bacterium]|nr:hypothetical protein [Planctomycetota bacterium]
MIRAFLLGFFAGPLPFIIWSTLLQRASRPDTLAQSLGGIAGAVPLLCLLARLSRRHLYLLCWFATAGTLFWAALRYALRYAAGPGEGLLFLAMFPVTGFKSLESDGILLFPVTLLTWGFLAGFAAILRRASPPAEEKEEAPDDDEDEPPPAPPDEPYFVERPPPKPKGPPTTPKTREEPPPREKWKPGM